MNTLYLVVIAPLAQLYGIGFEICLNLTHHYVLALVCLSVVVTLVLVPLKRITLGMQRREKRIQEIMEPQIAAIKAESVGAERHHRIAGLHRRYAYNPLYALRSSLGFLLQLPFLIGAYVMLSGYQPIQGEPFWIIPDLGRPDGLLGGINVLPFVMSGVNLAALLTTEEFGRRERLQGMVITVLFLVLLYSSPSALLLYWTANNAWMVLQNLLRRYDWFGLRSVLCVLVSAIRGIPDGHARMLLVGLSISPMLAALCASVFGRGFMVSVSLDNPRYVMLGVLVAVGSLLPTVFFLKPSGRQLWFFIPWAASLVVYLQSNGFLSILPWEVQGLFLLLLLMPACLLLLFLRLRRSHGRISLGDVGRWTESVFAGRGGAVYAVSVISVGILWFVFSPTALYFSAPYAFEYHIRDIFPHLCSWLVCWCLLFALLWAVCPLRLRGALSLLMPVVTLILLLNGLVLLVNQGIISGMRLQVPSLDHWFWELDLLAFILAIAVIAFQRMVKGTRWFLYGMVSVAMGLAAYSVVNIFNPMQYSGGSASEFQTMMQSHPDGRFLTLSDNATNCIFVVLDQFDSLGVEEHLRKQPDLVERFSGFTWYPDTVADGNCTLLSLPSMFGGHEYTPPATNRDRSRTRYEKDAEGMASLPNDFAKNGYEVFLLGELTPNPEFYSWIRRGITHSDSVFAARKLPPSLIAQWATKIGCPELSAIDERDGARVMLAIGLFRISPYWLKPRVYADGQWMPDSERMPMFKTLRESAALALLPEVSRSRSGNPTLTILYSMATHESWHLPEDSPIPVAVPGEGKAPVRYFERDSGLRRDQMFSEAHALRWLADFFDWMREHKVYDNTLIVVASDHSAFPWNTHGFFQSKEVESRPGAAGSNSLRPSSLLMVKYPEKRHPLTASSDPMRSSDTATILRVALQGRPWTPPVVDPDRVRRHFMGHWQWNQHPSDHYVGNEYEVRGHLLDEMAYELQ